MKLGISEKGLHKLAKIAQEDKDFATVEDADYDEYGESSSVPSKKLTKTEIKHLAQDTIMGSMPAAFYTIGDSPDYSEEDKELLYAEMEKQVSRIERLFGYDIGSWPRW